MTRPLLSLVLAASLFVAGCGDAVAPAAATVNGEKIPIQEVDVSLEKFRAAPGYDKLAKNGDIKELEKQREQARLTQLINEAVFEPIAEERGIEVTDEEVQERLESIKTTSFQSQEEYEKALEDQALTEEELVPLLRYSILEERLRADVTEDALEQYHEEHPEEFTQYRVSHILVKSKPLASRLATRLQRAPEPKVGPLFARLAKEHSTHTGSGAQGGDLGYAPAGQYVPTFKEAVETLEIGVVSDPVKSEFGYHIIRVTDEKVLSLEEATQQLGEQSAQPAPGQAVVDEAWNEFVRKAFEDADIEVNPRYGEFDPEQRAVVDASAESVPGADVPPSAEASPPPAD